MSEENLEILRWAYEIVSRTGELNAEVVHPDFVWNMSTTGNWPEQQTYQSMEEANAFLRDWIGAWDDWETVVESLHDAGDKIVAITHQRGRSKETAIPLDMQFAQVWTFRDGKATRMDMYNDRAEALKAAGLSE